MAAPTDLPLWQSFVGALGAFVVAAFTVWWTRKHTWEREEKQARRNKNAERQKVLRDKLEACVGSVEAAYEIQASAARYLRDAEDQIAANEPPRGDAPNNRSHLASWSAMRKAVVLAELYFPTLVPPVDSVHHALREVQNFAEEEGAQMSADHLTWRAGGGKDFERRFVTQMQMTAVNRRMVLSEARRLFSDDFDLKD